MIALHILILTAVAASAELGAGIVQTNDRSEISARARLVPALVSSQDILPVDVELRMPLGRGEAPRISAARLSLYAVHFDNGISLRFGQMRLEERQEALASRWLIDPAIFGWATKIPFGRSETIAL